MPQFSYYGRNKHHEAVRGHLEASSAANVVDWLTQAEITPVSIEPLPTHASLSEQVGAWLTQQLLSGARLTALDLLMLTRQLYALLKAGVPILRALRGLEQTTPNRSMRTVLNELIQGLESGVELSQAMARRPDVFNSFYVSMMRMGETAGHQEDVLLGLCEYLEFQRYMREQVRNALRYPLFVLLAMAAALVVINIFVIPSFARVFANLHTELPLMTRILLGSSQFFVQAWPFVLAAAVATALIARVVLASERGAQQWARIKLALPIAGEIARKGVLAQVMRGLSLMFRSGVPVGQGLTLTAQVVQNAYIASALHSMRSHVERGDTLLAASQRAGVFTPLVLQMIAVGEESGRLPEMLDDISQFYQHDCEYGLKTLAQRIEPLLIILIGALVLVLALGVFLPMWDLSRAAIK